MSEQDRFHDSITLIESGRTGLTRTVRECWDNRELLGFLALRDLRVRYKQTFFGVTWAIIQPVVTMAVFTFVFHRVAAIDTGDVPYPVFSYTGLLPWLLFQSALTQSSSSIVSNARLLTKVYFPRLLIPLASVLSCLVDFALSFTVLIALMFYYGVPFGWNLLALPAFIALSVLAALSIGIWFSALNAKYRDFAHATPFLVRIWMFLTPVAYPLSSMREAMSDNLDVLLLLNPMVGVVEGFRWALIGQTDFDVEAIYLSVPITLLLFAMGVAVFRQMERTFADML